MPCLKLIIPEFWITSVKLYLVSSSLNVVKFPAVKSSINGGTCSPGDGVVCYVKRIQGLMKKFRKFYQIKLTASALQTSAEITMDAAFHFMFSYEDF